MKNGRLIDIPYHTSPPLLFTFKQTAVSGAVVVGQYNFTTVPVTKIAFTPSRPINGNVLYSFQTVTFAMDIDQSEYQDAIQVQPEFSMYLQSDATGPALREPIVLAKYLEIVPYRLHILGSDLLNAAYPGQSGFSAAAQGYSFNRLLGTVNGILNQTPSLIGRNSITAVLIFSVQEIVDDEFIRAFKGESAAEKSVHYLQ